MTVESRRTGRAISPARRFRARLAAARRIDRGALSAEFAVLLCVGAGMAFLLYSALKNFNVADVIVEVVLGIVKGLIGGMG